MTDTTPTPAADAAATPAAAPAAVAPPTKTFALVVPIADDAGQAITSLTLRMPTLGDQTKIARQTTAGPLQATAARLSVLSGVPESAIRRLKNRDLMPMIDWLGTISGEQQPQALRAVLAQIAELQNTARIMLAALADVAPPDVMEPTRTFQLETPVKGAGGDITELTVREPDLESGIAVERFTSESEQTCAMIALLSGQTIPVISRLTVPDARRIERWLGFFFGAGASSPAPEASTPAPVATTADASTAGAASPSSSPTA